MAFQINEYLVRCGIGDDVIVDFIDTLSVANTLTARIATNDRAKLPTDSDVSLAKELIFAIGSVLNNSLAWTLESIVGPNANSTSSDLVKQYNMFYQEVFASYIKPLNQAIAYHEHRL